SDGAVGITEGLLVVVDVPGESGDRGASDPTGRAPIPGSGFGFFGEGASDRKTLVRFVSVGEWIAERVFGAPGSFPDGLGLPGGWFFTSPGWMAWRSLYEQSLREMLETEFQIAETLRITEADAVVSEQAGVVSLVVTLTFNQDVAGRIEAGDLVIRDAEEGDGTEISMRYDP